MKHTFLAVVALAWKRLNDEDKSLVAAHAGWRDGPELPEGLHSRFAPGGRMHEDTAEAILILATREISAEAAPA